MRGKTCLQFADRVNAMAQAMPFASHAEQARWPRAHQHGDLLLVGLRGLVKQPPAGHF